MNSTLHYLRRKVSDNQVIMFPFAAGHGRSFSEFVKYIIPDAEIIGINPPGHLFGSDRPLESINDLVALYIKELKPVMRKNVVVYGHSMGGTVAYEFCRRLEPGSVISVVLSGSHPPHRRLQDEEDGIDSSMSESEIIEKCISYGGFDESLKNEQEFCSLFCDIMKADLKALENYETGSVIQRLNIPLEIFYGSNENLKAEEAEEWNKYFSLQKVIRCEGNHFFILDIKNTTKVCRSINSAFSDQKRINHA